MRFARRCLRSHAAEAGLDPTFGVLDQADADVLQYEVIDDVLRDRLTALDADTLDLATAFGLAPVETTNRRVARDIGTPRVSIAG